MIIDKCNNIWSGAATKVGVMNLPHQNYGSGVSEGLS